MPVFKTKTQPFFFSRPPNQLARFYTPPLEPPSPRGTKAITFFKPSSSTQIFLSSSFLKRSPRQLFNQGTLSNVYRYLSTQETLSFKRNESGFIRTSLPCELLVPDHQIQPLRPGDRLRINFWNDFSQTLNEESIHDHPNFFQSYLIHGGYRHIVYSISAKPFLQSTSAKLFLPLKTFQYSLDKHSKQITEHGITYLIPQKDEIVRKGDLIFMDPSVIHKVCEYHIVPNEKTLSLNIVRQGPKKPTHIFLQQNEIQAVKTEREGLSLEDSQKAHEELKTLFGKAL